MPIQSVARVVTVLFDKPLWAWFNIIHKTLDNPLFHVQRDSGQLKFAGSYNMIYHSCVRISKSDDNKIISSFCKISYNLWVNQEVSKNCWIWELIPREFYSHNLLNAASLHSLRATDRWWLLVLKIREVIDWEVKKPLAGFLRFARQF